MRIEKGLLWLLVLCLAVSPALADGGAELVGSSEWTQGSVYGIQPVSWSVQNNPEDFGRAMDNDRQTVYRFVAWSSLALDAIPEASFTFDGVTLKDIWIRNGNQSGEQAYFANARVKRLNVIIYTGGIQAAKYEYRLKDQYDISSRTESWQNGYQRVSLPRTFTNVTGVELWILNWYTGNESTYQVCVSDIAFSDGTQNIAGAVTTPEPYPYGSFWPSTTPAPYSGYWPTSTPRSYDSWTTRTPGYEAGYWPTSTPRSSSGWYVRPTATPEPDLRSGIDVRLKERMATRSGPGTRYDELGSYFEAGTWVRALSAAYDEVNEVWWIQTEFTYRGEKRRAYTGLKRLDMLVTQVPIEFLQQAGVRLKRSVYGYYGPGYGYAMHGDKIPAGTVGDIWMTEGAYALIEFYDSQKGTLRRIWVPESSLEISDQAVG